MSSEESQSIFKNLTDFLGRVAQTLKEVYSVDCEQVGYILLCKPCPRHSQSHFLIYDPVTPLRYFFHNFVPFTCEFSDTYFDLIGFTDKEVAELRQILHELKKEDFQRLEAETILYFAKIKSKPASRERLRAYYEILFKDKAPVDVILLAEKLKRGERHEQ